MELQRDWLDAVRHQPERNDNVSPAWPAAMHQANTLRTTSGLGFGSSLGFHAESHEFDSRSLRCILLPEDSGTPCCT